MFGMGQSAHSLFLHGNRDAATTASVGHDYDSK